MQTKPEQFISNEMMVFNLILWPRAEGRRARGIKRSQGCPNGGRRASFRVFAFFSSLEHELFIRYNPCQFRKEMNNNDVCSQLGPVLCKRKT